MSIEDDIKKALADEGIDASEAIKKANITEEIKTPETKVEKVKEEQEEKQYADREFSDFEKEQMEKGWNPDGPKSAEQWAEMAPLYDEIHERRRENKRLKKAIDALTEHMTKAEKVAYERALETLRQERDNAISRGDVQEVHRIEQEQEKLTKKPEVIQEVEEFKDKYSNILNSSNFEEMEIAAFVLNRDKELMSRKLPYAEHMKTLEEHMLKKFPNYFNAGKKVVDRSHRTEVEMGEGSNVVKSNNTKKRYSVNDLSDTQKQVWNSMKKYTKMSVDEYISDLVKFGDLK